MITIDMLQRFCADDHARATITKPFSFGDYTYATNGHVCIRVPRMAEVTPESDIITRLTWDHEEISGWQEMPYGYLVPPMVLCPSCRGSKLYQACLGCEFNRACDEDEMKDCERLMETGARCTECDRDGRVYGKRCFRVLMCEGGTNLNGEYLELLRILPGHIWIAPDPKDSLHANVRIRSSAGWDGLLMPMRPEGGRIS